MRGGSGILKYVPIKRLYDLCSRALASRLCLITAPSGYGKTCLIEHFLSEYPENNCRYIKLDAEEESRTEAEKLLLSEINLGKEKIIVVDDCYRMERAWMDMIMREVVIHSGKVHIVLIDRKEPAAYCDELAAEGFCIVMDRFDLKFTDSDVQTIALENEIEIGRNDCDKCIDLTDGCCLAVCMMLGQYAETKCMCDSPHIVAYIRKFMIDRMSRHERRILISLAAAEVFDREQARFITRDSRAYDIMMNIRENYGLISIEDNWNARMSNLLIVAAGTLPEANEMIQESIFRNALWHESRNNLKAALAGYYRGGCIDDIFRLLDRQDVINFTSSDYPLLEKMLVYMKHSQLQRMRELYAAVEPTFMFFSVHGEYEKSVVRTIEAVNAVQRVADMSFPGSTELLLAEFYYQTGDIARSLSLAEEAMALAAWNREPVTAIASSYIQARCRIYMGKKPIKTYNSEFVSKNSSAEMKKYSNIYDLSQVLLYGLYQENCITDWMREGIIPETGRLVAGSGLYQKALGIGCINAGKYDRLSHIAAAMHEETPYGNFVARIITADIFKAIAFWNRNALDKVHREKAVIYMEKALKIAQKDNMKMIFAEFGTHIRPILEKTQKTLFRDEILRMCIKYEAGQRNLLTRKAKARLTKREKDIAKKLVAGHTNREIAVSLNIAIVTVEKNLSAIYRKIGAQNRSAAVSRLMNADYDM